MRLPVDAPLYQDGRYELPAAAADVVRLAVRVVVGRYDVDVHGGILHTLAYVVKVRGNVEVISDPPLGYKGGVHV